MTYQVLQKNEIEIELVFGVSPLSKSKLMLSSGWGKLEHSIRAIYR